MSSRIKAVKDGMVRHSSNYILHLLDSQTYMAKSNGDEISSGVGIVSTPRSGANF